MSCDICGRSNCCASFHSSEEQDRYAKVIEAFDYARELRARMQREERETETDNE